MSFPNILHIAEEEVFNSYTTENVPVGSKAVLSDGRVFRFSENGADALVAGNVHSGVVPHTDFTDEAVATLAAGVTVLTGVGSTNTNVVANLLKYGYVYSDSATAANFMPMHRIKSNTLIPAGSATGTITLFTPLALPIAAAGTISYFRNPWRDVIIAAAGTVALCTGVAPIALAADAFGWLQTQGPCAVAYNSTTTALAAVGDPVANPVNVAGAVDGMAAGTAETNQIIGYVLGVVQADTEMTAVFLTIE